MWCKTETVSSPSKTILKKFLSVKVMHTLMGWFHLFWLITSLLMSCSHSERKTSHSMFWEGQGMSGKLDGRFCGICLSQMKNVRTCSQQREHVLTIQRREEPWIPFFQTEFCVCVFYVYGNSFLSLATCILPFLHLSHVRKHHHTHSLAMNSLDMFQLYSHMGSLRHFLDALPGGLAE